MTYEKVALNKDVAERLRQLSHSLSTEYGTRVTLSMTLLMLLDKYGSDAEFRERFGITAERFTIASRKDQNNG